MRQASEHVSAVDVQLGKIKALEDAMASTDSAKKCMEAELKVAQVALKTERSTSQSRIEELESNMNAKEGGIAAISKRHTEEKSSLQVAIKALQDDFALKEAELELLARNMEEEKAAFGLKILSLEEAQQKQELSCQDNIKEAEGLRSQLQDSETACLDLVKATAGLNDEIAAYKTSSAITATEVADLQKAAAGLNDEIAAYKTLTAFTATEVTTTNTTFEVAAVHELLASEAKISAPEMGRISSKLLATALESNLSPAVPSNSDPGGTTFPACFPPSSNVLKKSHTMVGQHGHNTKTAQEPNSFGQGERMASKKVKFSPKSGIIEETNVYTKLPASPDRLLSQLSNKGKPAGFHTKQNSVPAKAGLDGIHQSAVVDLSSHYRSEGSKGQAANSLGGLKGAPSNTAKAGATAKSKKRSNGIHHTYEPLDADPSPPAKVTNSKATRKRVKPDTAVDMLPPPPVNSKDMAMHHGADPHDLAPHNGGSQLRVTVGEGKNRSGRVSAAGKPSRLMGMKSSGNGGAKGSRALPRATPEPSFSGRLQGADDWF
eukprot:gene7465-606_t